MSYMIDISRDRTGGRGVEMRHCKARKVGMAVPVGIKRT